MGFPGRLWRVALALALCLGLSGAAEAHPKPYPHKHAVAKKPKKKAKRKVVKHEEPDTRPGPYVGISVLGNMVFKNDENLTEVIRSGGGLGLKGGFRFSQYGALEVGWLGSYHKVDSDKAEYGSGVLTGVTVDGRIFVSPESRRIEPYVLVGGGAYLFHRGGYKKKELTGGGLHLGGGVDFNANPALILGVGVVYRGISMDDASTTGLPAVESMFMSVVGGEANVRFHF